MATLNWVKCQGGVWCNLEKVNLEGIGNVSGVYCIWHGGSNSRWVRVGQGDIRERLSSHRRDMDILAYSKYGLFVTWAQVDISQRDGIEAYLSIECNPIVGERFPDRKPIPVNLPK